MKIHTINDLSDTRVIAVLKKGLSKITDQKTLVNYYSNSTNLVKSQYN